MNSRTSGRRTRVGHDVTTRLMRSMAFRRSREASGEILDDAGSLRKLAEDVRERDYREGDLEPVAPHIDAALQFVDDRAHLLEGEAAGPASPPAQVAKRRLLVAALHYLTRRDDLIPDDNPAGSIDDVVVVQEVLGNAAETELTPYLADDGDEDQNGRPDSGRQGDGHQAVGDGRSAS